MPNATTWHYDQVEQAKNVTDELRAAGVPAECIFVDEPAQCVKILIAEAAKPAVKDILRAHGLTERP